MKSSTYLSLGLLLAVVAWMFSGVFANAPDEAQEHSSANDNQVAEIMKVSVINVQAQKINRKIVVQGELEPMRQVLVKAQTSSRVIELPVNKGDHVNTDSILIKLAREDRSAQLKQAQAEVENQTLEVSAMRKLKQQGLQAETRLKSAESALATAQAQLTRARLELSYLKISTPFAGFVEERYVEIGSHVAKGDKVALIIDKSVLKAVGEISQQSAGQLSLGQPTRVRLLDGREAVGKITFISRVGDAETHSFRVEADVPNTDGQLNAGVSAELSITVGQEFAHFLSPSILSLNDRGVIGVKSVTPDNKVAFHAVKLVRTEVDGVWLSGLPQNIDVITLGQGFVNSGDSVMPVADQRS